MNKNRYVEPEIKLLPFETGDILRASDGDLDGSEIGGDGGVNFD